MYTYVRIYMYLFVLYKLEFSIGPNQFVFTIFIKYFVSYHSTVVIILLDFLSSFQYVLYEMKLNVGNVTL